MKPENGYNHLEPDRPDYARKSHRPVSTRELDRLEEQRKLDLLRRELEPNRPKPSKKCWKEVLEDVLYEIISSKDFPRRNEGKSRKC